MLLATKRFRPLFLVYGVSGIYLSACLLFLVQSRYRTPAVPYLCLFAGSAICSLREMTRGRRFKALCLSLLACAVFFSLSHVAFKNEMVQQDRWQEATKNYYQMRALPSYHQGRYGEAIPDLNRCLSIVPDFIPGLNLRGKTYAMLGEYRKAQMDFERLILLRPLMAQGYRGMGFTCLLQGETDQAKSHLRKALALAPHDKKVKEALKDLR